MILTDNRIMNFELLVFLKDYPFCMKFLKSIRFVSCEYVMRYSDFNLYCSQIRYGQRRFLRPKIIILKPCVKFGSYRLLSDSFCLTGTISISYISLPPSVNFLTPGRRRNVKSYHRRRRHE